MKKPTLIVSMPSSGSDWFQSCFIESSKHAIKEPFNPIMNIDRPEWHEVKDLFGCELIECVGNTFRDFTKQERESRAQVMMDICGNAEVVKDNFMFATIDEYVVQNFNVVYLLRDTHETFPPTRRRVWNWYSTLRFVYNGMRDTTSRLASDDSQNEIVSMHEHCYSLAKSKAHEFDLPIIKYECLTDLNFAALAALLQRTLPENVSPYSIARAITTTRDNSCKKSAKK